MVSAVKEGYCEYLCALLRVNAAVWRFIAGNKHKPERRGSEEPETAAHSKGTKRKAGTSGLRQPSAASQGNVRTRTATEVTTVSSPYMKKLRKDTTQAPKASEQQPKHSKDVSKATKDIQKPSKQVPKASKDVSKPDKDVTTITAETSASNLTHGTSQKQL